MCRFFFLIKKIYHTPKDAENLTLACSAFKLDTYHTITDHVQILWFQMNLSLYAHIHVCHESLLTGDVINSTLSRFGGIYISNTSLFIAFSQLAPHSHSAQK